MPEHLVKPFGKIAVQKIDTKPKPNHFVRNVLITIAVIFILLKVLKSKGKSGIPLFMRIAIALYGLRTPKDWIYKY